MSSMLFTILDESMRQCDLKMHMLTILRKLYVERRNDATTKVKLRRMCCIDGSMDVNIFDAAFSMLIYLHILTWNHRAMKSGHVPWFRVHKDFIDHVHMYFNCQPVVYDEYMQRY